MTISYKVSDPLVHIPSIDIFCSKCSNLFLLRNYKGHYIAQMASKWLKNKPKLKISTTVDCMKNWTSSNKLHERNNSCSNECNSFGQVRLFFELLDNI